MVEVATYSDELGIYGLLAGFENLEADWSNILLLHTSDALIGWTITWIVVIDNGRPGIRLR